MVMKLLIYFRSIEFRSSILDRRDLTGTTVVGGGTGFGTATTGAGGLDICGFDDCSFDVCDFGGCGCGFGGCGFDVCVCEAGAFATGTAAGTVGVGTVGVAGTGVALAALPLEITASHSMKRVYTFSISPTSTNLCDTK